MSNQASSCLLDNLISALRCLPGVGPKSAQRMTYHLLQKAKPQARVLSQALEAAMTHIIHCQHCNNFSEHDICSLCADATREPRLVVVESPNDLLAIEQTHEYRGRYFVLMGHLSPLDGIGPKDIGVDKLLAVVKSHAIKEIIFAINPGMEGEATRYYLSQLLSPLNIPLSQLAHGVPIGTELEFLDSNTIKRAMKGRNVMEA